MWIELQIEVNQMERINVELSLSDTEHKEA